MFVDTAIDTFDVLMLILFKIKGVCTLLLLLLFVVVCY